MNKIGTELTLVLKPGSGCLEAPPSISPNLVCMLNHHTKKVLKSLQSIGGTCLKSHHWGDGSEG